MITLDILVLALLAEAVVIFVVVAIYFAFRYRKLRRNVRRYLQRRKQFLLVLEETREALKASRKQAIQQWIAEHDGSNEQAEAIENARLEYVDACIESFRSSEGELYRFWRGAYSGMHGIFSRLADCSAKSQPAGIIDQQPNATATPKPEQTSQSDLTPEDEETRLAYLERIIRYQASKISELNEFRWRFEELNTRFINIRANNERLKQKLYDLLWAQENQEQGPDAQALEQAMAEFERSNKELALCVETLEEENRRLQAHSEQSEQAQAEYLQSVETQAERSQDELAGDLTTLQTQLDEAQQDNTALRKELADLQREYVALYAQQQANKKT